MKTTEAKLGRSFGWLNTAQFLGALNDNIFKLLIIGFVIDRQGLTAAGKAASLAGAVFVVPFLLFTAFAGKLADRFSKRDVIVWCKAAEVGVMVAGCIAFFSGSMAAVYAILFLMAAHSSFFGPSKYGIVPELVGMEQLSRANGMLEALTNLAIVLGTALGPLLSDLAGGRFTIAASVCVAISLAGLAAGTRISRTPAAGGSNRASVFFVKDIVRTLWSIRGDGYLLLAVIGSAYFMLIGTLIYINVIPYGIEHLGLPQIRGGYLFIPAAVGIGLGAYGAGRLSGRNVEFGIVPLGALGLAFTSIGLGLASAGLYGACAWLLLGGFSAGLFVVPVHAFIQFRSPAARRGEILAAAGFCGWVGVLCASGLVYVFNTLLAMSASHIFVLLGCMTLVLAIIMVILMPDFLVRFICLVVVRLCYRVRIVGAENVPIKGGALLVANHASLVDAPLLISTQQRRIRFVMDRDIYNSSWLKPVFKLMGVIIVSAGDPPRKILGALEEARAAIDAGFMVCIFAEGSMTRTGMLRSFRRGFERIIRNSKYNVIPIYIGGAWGSIFSYYHGKPFSTLPKKFPYPVSIHFGRSMPANSTAAEIRRQVIELSCDYFDALKPSRRSLAEQFITLARKSWKKRCICDASGRRLSYGRTLASATALADKLEKLTTGQNTIGVLLPPSVGGVLANVAVTMLGKAAVNLNYVVSEQARQAAVDQCGIKCVISSRHMVEKMENLRSRQGLIFLEDIIERIDLAAKVRAWLKARFMPRRILANARGFCADDLATIIFTSGSSGAPKGVMLSHHNIISNIEGARMVFRLRRDDNICAVLPFFHSFGFTCTLWLPLVTGISASYIPNPLDGKTVGRAAREDRSTLLFATPTFLANYVRKAEPGDFESLRFVVVGAEKLNENMADAFEARFGIRPVEGYGATELSPVVSLNLPDVTLGGVHQTGNKPGAVGHPMPGVAVRVVNIDSGELLPPDSEGLLLVKGPNVMLGYLHHEKETAEVIRDRWFHTGDIAKVDEEGFITLGGRLSRFSKIAGEMVPHGSVEQVYLDGLGTAEQLVAVTGMPDPHKGEQLVVLYVEQAGDADKLHKIISESSLPNIFKPRRDNYIKIESMPVLGSGKLDVLRLRKIALAAQRAPVGKAQPGLP
jgi:acyl-[acyl-carrier-protein]-phospholipid O-acyltransferase/long-chain-fatty-acid--[acyl-carrier-protein] ligase